MRLGKTKLRSPGVAFNVGVTKDSALYTGKTIAYKLPYAGSGNASLQLYDSSGNAVGGNIAVYSMNTRVTTHYPAYSVIQMTFDGSYWRTAGWYNTDTYNRTRWQSVILAAGAITNGHIICGTASGYKNIAAGVAFDLSYPLLYCATTKAAGETSDNNYLQINGTNQGGEIMYPTYAKPGTEYPFRVPEGTLYLLGDYRTQTEDSRDFGPIPMDDIQGKVITIVRRRGV